jgi:putative flippase GtrA
MLLPPEFLTLVDRLAPAWIDRVVLHKAINFALVGLVNMVVDFGLFATGYYVIGWPIIVANVVSWSIAVSGSYVMNSMTTFAAESGGQLRFKDYIGFVVSQSAGLVGNTATVFVASYFIPVWLGKVLAIGVSFLINFSLSHLVVFRRRPGAPMPGE